MARGYTEKEIRGILGENFLRVLDEILTTKEQEINR
jgi:microsomal dipeptidase-like Zn-dependent dipeptidase